MYYTLIKMQFGFNILTVWIMLLIFQKNFNSTAFISSHIIIVLCDGMLHLIDNQSIHSNLQNYDSKCRVLINYLHTAFQSKTVHFNVLFILFAFRCKTCIIREDITCTYKIFYKTNFACIEMHVTL